MKGEDSLPVSGWKGRMGSGGERGKRVQYGEGRACLGRCVSAGCTILALVEQPGETRSEGRLSQRWQKAAQTRLS